MRLYVYVGDQHSFWGAQVHGRRALRAAVRRHGSDPGHSARRRRARARRPGSVGGVGGVAVDERGRVYVLDSSTTTASSASARAGSSRVNGTPGAAPGQLKLDQRRDRAERRVPLRRRSGQPPGPALPPRRRRVAGQPAARLRLAGTGPGQFNFVQDVAVDPARDHDVFAADDRNDRIHRLTADLAFTSFIGTLGRGPGGSSRRTHGHGPRRPAVRGRQLAPAGGAVRRTGAFTARLRRRRAAAGAAQQRALGIAVAPRADAAGGVFATNTSLNDISEFGVDGAFIRRWGGDGRGPRAFMQPARRRGRGQRRHHRRRHARGPRRRCCARTAASRRGRASARARRAGQRPGPAPVPRPERRGDRPAQRRCVGRRGRPPPCPADPAGRRQDEGHHLRRVDAGSTPGRFTEPLGVAVAADGTVWVADTRNHRLQRLRPARPTPGRSSAASCVRPRWRC